MSEKIRFDVLLPTEEQIKEQVRTMLEGPPVVCYFAEFPPLPGERSLAYQRRVMPEIWRQAFPPKKTLWQRLFG